jgi:hypothetical protein
MIHGIIITRTHGNTTPNQSHLRRETDPQTISGWHLEELWLHLFLLQTSKQARLARTYFHKHDLYHLRDQGPERQHQHELDLSH